MRKLMLYEIQKHVLHVSTMIVLYFDDTSSVWVQSRHNIFVMLENT